MVKVLVTGGLGFIGSNLVKELRCRRHDVCICDVRHSADPKSIRCDVGRYRQVEQLFDEYEFDYVYHAAAEYGRWNGENYYENLWLTNAVGTKNLLKVQTKKRFRMIFFGSAEVYGDYDGVMSEDVMENIPIKQMNDYALSKWVNEVQIINSAAMDGTETVRVRLFNVYGPGEYYSPYRGVVPIFIHKALHKEAYTVYLGHKRTFEYVKDICRTLGNIINHFKSGEVYNIGSEKQYEIKYLSDLILGYLGLDDSKVTYMEVEPFTTRIKQPNSSKAKRDLDHKISVPLEEGIPTTIEWVSQVQGLLED